MRVFRSLAIGAAVGALLLAGVPVAAQGVGRAVLPQAEDAAEVAAAREYQRSGRARVLEVGGYVVHPFGQTQPRLTCAPLRACTIQLEAGETPWVPYTGDTERWFVGTSPGPRGAMLVVVQPSDCDLTTNLTIPTDRRVYHLTLDAPPCMARDTIGGNPDLPYQRMMRFYYPEDLLARLESARAAADSAQAVRRAAEGRETPVAAAFDPATLDFGYTICRDRGFPWRVQVFHDGERTYVRLPPEARLHEAPVLFALAADGVLTLLGVETRGDVLVAERVLERGVLLLGEGGGAPLRLLFTRHARDCTR